MKILQIFGAVVAVHLLAFIFIFASPGCQSPTNVPTPDATVPPTPTPAPMGFNSPSAAPAPVDLGTAVTTYAPESDHASPTRPGSPAAMAVTPAKPTPEVAPISTYTVDRGDSLWSIAKKNGLAVSELAKANKLSTGAVLKPGHKLIVPGKVGAAPMAADTVATAKVEKPVAHVANGESVKHTVQPGESLGVIARKYQVRTADLAMANNITDPSKVRAGQQLMIPGFTAVTPKAKVSTPTSSAPVAAKAKVSAPAAAPAPVAETPEPPSASMTPKFEIKAPPVGQDLDAGLKDGSTEVPTIKVE